MNLLFSCICILCYKVITIGGPQVLTAMTMKKYVYVATPYRLVDVYRHFGGNHCIRLQYKNVSQATLHLLSASCWLLCLAYFSTLKMDSVRSFEMLANILQTRRRYIITFRNYYLLTIYFLFFLDFVLFVSLILVFINSFMFSSSLVYQFLLSQVVPFPPLTISF